MGKIKRLPLRSKVKPADCWNLASLYAGDAQWTKAFAAWEEQVERYEQFRGKLGESPKSLADCLKFDTEFERLGERIGTYGFLKHCEDEGDGVYQAMKSRYIGVASKASQAASYIRPELLAIPTAKFKKFLADPALVDFKIALERIVRYKPHTLTDNEERLLAMQTEMSSASNQIFGQLHNVDMKFGTIETTDGDTADLSHAFYSTCLHSPDRDLRQRAFHQYYVEYSDHSNTLAATLNASIQKDVYYAKARNYSTALESALFDDDVPLSVYDNLIATVRKGLPSVYRYFDVRRRAMKLKKIHHYDTYVPIVSELEKRHTWSQAVKLVVDSLHPLGGDYCKTLEAGLNGRWCDRYENKGKHSGAFSSGSFDAEPFILMNYQPNVLDHVFTLAHEAGHSMHSFYSAKHQPFQYYNYTIFVAEVASTFNEQLLNKHLMDQAKSKDEKAFYINREIDAIRGTIIRQTMFAEFEKITHTLAEANEPLTLDRLKSEYRKLLEAYFGPAFTLDNELELECLRIPHFYRAFYVYKYATGLSAAIALSERVTNGGPKELGDYLGFLKAGCSKYPLEILADAGVDMRSPEPIETAMRRFALLVDELEMLLL